MQYTNPYLIVAAEHETSVHHGDNIVPDFSSFFFLIFVNAILSLVYF